MGRTTKVSRSTESEGEELLMAQRIEVREEEVRSLELVDFQVNPFPYQEQGSQIVANK